MAETLREAVGAAAEQVNPGMSRSCPLSELAHGVLKLAPGTAHEGENMSWSQLVQRFVLYSKAPPAMMHVTHLVSCYNIPTADGGDKPPSQSPGNFDLDKFIEFFTPQPIGNTSKAREKEAELIIHGWSSSWSSSTECGEDYILRDALLEACERLGIQFGSLSPTPREFLMQRLAAATMTMANSNVDMSSNQDSLLDTTFANVIENSLAKFEQSSERSSSKLIEFIVAAIDEDLFDFPMKMVLSERLIFCSMPHPEASAGSRALLECFRKAIYWVRSDLELADDTLAMEALVAAIDRLGAGIEVKELLKLVMRETLLMDWKVYARIPHALGMKMKFKVKNDIPKDSSNSKILATRE